MVQPFISHIFGKFVNWKPISSWSSSALLRSDKNMAQQRGKNLSNVDFGNPKISFAASSTRDLFRACFVFKLCSYNFLVQNNKKLMQQCHKYFGSLIFNAIMKATIYGHFVAGEDQDKIQPLIRRYRKYGVKSILDYSVEKDIPEEDAVKKIKEFFVEAARAPEFRSAASTRQYQASLKFADRSKAVVSARTYFYESEEKCDENMHIFMKSIDAASKSIKGEGFTAFKLTALGRPQFLLQLSDSLVQMERFFGLLIDDEKSDGARKSCGQALAALDVHSFRQRLEELGIKISFDNTLKRLSVLDTSGSGPVDLLDWLHFKDFEYDLASIFEVKNKETGKTEQLVPTLTPDGMEQMRNMINRIDTLARHAKLKNVRLMVDAEHTYFQPAIRRLTMEMMRRFNKDSAVIFITYQCYLKNAFDQLSVDLNLAAVEDFYFGAKLVRGAYLDQERKRAADLGYSDPINPTFEATTEMFERCLETCFHSISQRALGRVSFMVATHNIDSVRFALRKMEEYTVHPEHKLVCFGQLLGMCDHISFPLGRAGYSVYKYVPYGPVNDVLSYLSRRASENQSILSNVSVEKKLRWNEILRRLVSGNLFYAP